ncbi:tigger transposable element-derived protein 2-like [Rhagoletis pomonella]|uniref:tigger transposable element-derived protein 2-like n=1 Tax=Rhagoletis pomonella TaxID=28610 RepID=UPI0017806299|nr:tigger transposable element-derived protein 2-like [Rhagoletis pomonella]
MFFPPNVTPLIQPMDQNAIKITKLYYRTSLLAMMAAKNSDLVSSMKTVTLKDAVTFLEIAWNKVSTDTMAKCWKNLLSFTESEEDPEENVPLSILKANMDSELQLLMTRAVDVLNELNPQVDYTVPSIEEWNQDILLDDVTGSGPNEELEVSDDDAYDVHENLQTVKPSEAIEIFNRALDWAGCENVSQDDLNLLRRLRVKAVFQLLERKKQQKKITDFF